MSNALRSGNRSISYEQSKEMLFPELIPQKGNEAMLSTVPHEKVEDMAVVFRLDLHSESGMMMSTSRLFCCNLFRYVAKRLYYESRVARLVIALQKLNNSGRKFNNQFYCCKTSA